MPGVGRRASHWTVSPWWGDFVSVPWAKQCLAYSTCSINTCWMMDEINSKEGKGSNSRKEFGVEKEWEKSEQQEGEREIGADRDGEIRKSQIMQNLLGHNMESGFYSCMTDLSLKSLSTRCHTLISLLRSYDHSSFYICHIPALKTLVW